MLDEILKVQASAERLYDQQQVDTAISAMAEQINRQLAECNPLILCVMNGGIVTAGKLLPQLTMALTVDSINASRYQNQTTGAELKWLYKPQTPMHQRTVLIVDDILDAGITLQAIVEYCRVQGAKKILSAVLIDKQLEHSKPIQADFVGLITANRYLFGSGMDYQGYLRNAPGVYACAE